MSRDDQSETLSNTTIETNKILSELLSLSLPSVYHRAKCVLETSAVFSDVELRMRENEGEYDATVKPLIGLAMGVLRPSLATAEVASNIFSHVGKSSADYYIRRVSDRLNQGEDFDTDDVYNACVCAGAHTLGKLTKQAFEKLIDAAAHPEKIYQTIKSNYSAHSTAVSSSSINAGIFP